jgi:TonB family protein
MCYETRQGDRIKDLTEIWKQFAPPDSPKDPAAGTVLNGKALVLAKPDYPPEARARRLAGTIVVKVKIDETGQVIAAHDMCGGPPPLSESAVRAAFQSRFSPTKISGMPVKVDGIIQYTFVRY